MGDVACFVIASSTKENLEAFVNRIRDEWGEKLYDDFDVRVLSDVAKNCINIFQIVDTEEGRPVHLVFQQDNGYFIAWGTYPNKIIIFDDAHAHFELDKVQVNESLLREGKKFKKLNIQKQREVGQAEPPQTFRSTSGVDYQLTQANKCGLNSDYISLEKMVGLRESVNVGREALMAAFYEFRKKFVPKKEARHPNYIERISKSSISVIHTFPESFRNGRILKPLLERYEFGGKLPLYAVRIENEWAKHSTRAHVLMPKWLNLLCFPPNKFFFCRDLGLILKT